MKNSVIEYLKYTAEVYPDKVAIKDENGVITFKELDILAKKVATYILNVLGEETKRPIAVRMKKSKECIVAFLGIAYTGNFYCPIDYDMPKERANKIINKLDPVGLICENAETSFYDIKKEIYLDSIYEVKIDSRVDKQLKKVIDIDPLYVLFTSGSTGEPKGVVINHRSVIDYIEWCTSKFRFDNNTVFGNQAPFYFDNSILDIYCTIKNACTMVIIPQSKFLFPKNLIEYINENHINTLFWVPSALIGVANSGILKEGKRLQKLEKVMFCGEVMPNKQLNVWRKEYPDVMYANLYGPTEITDVCAYYKINREFNDDEPLPIGYACENTEILVLDENNNIVNDKTNTIGELCVRGTCLSLGYYGDFEKTNNAFIQNPMNDLYEDKIYKTGDLVKYNNYGELLFIGRKDSQIKYQGYRIELGEIETASNSLKEINQSCAIYDEKNNKIMLICVTNEEILQKQIYNELKIKLPHYMLPKVIKFIDSMPLNKNGKIDRQKLKNELCERGL